VTTENKETK